MQDLITTIESTMSTVDLWDMICHARSLNGEKPVRYNDLMNRVSDELEGEHYETFVVQNPNKTESMTAMLTSDQCMLVAMRESKAVRRNVLERLKQLDAKPQEPTWITNLSPQALVVIEDLNNKLEQQKAQMEAQKPAVEFVDRYTDSTGLVSLTQAAKDLQFKPRQFTNALQRDGYLYRTGGALTPYQRYIDRGLFHMVVGERGGHGYSQTKITNKGKAYFAQRYASEL